MNGRPKNMPNMIYTATVNPDSHMCNTALLTPCIQRGKTSGAQSLF